MTYRGHIENGRILLDEPAALAEGTPVDVAVADRAAADTVPAQRRALSEINKTPGVSGGAACVGHTRIAVWTLVQLKKLGRSEAQLLADFPGLTRDDLDAVWGYYREHPGEIDQTITDQERED
jgi:uncharacterized protein (DUF433 family)